MSFSDTLSALKLVIPVAQRPAAAKPKAAVKKAVKRPAAKAARPASPAAKRTRARAV